MDKSPPNLDVFALNLQSILSLQEIRQDKTKKPLVYSLWPNDCSQPPHIFLISRYNRAFPFVQCDESFSQSGDQKKHIGLHTGERPFLCHQCDKSFSQSSSLKTHVRIHTLRFGLVWLTCDTEVTEVNLNIPEKSSPHLHII